MTGATDAQLAAIRGCRGNQLTQLVDIGGMVGAADISVGHERRLVHNCSFRDEIPLRWRSWHKADGLPKADNHKADNPWPGNPWARQHPSTAMAKHQAVCPAPSQEWAPPLQVLHRGSNPGQG